MSALFPPPQSHHRRLVGGGRGGRGGALITAVRAAEYGIAVFAMPGDVDRESSEGCNLLIRDGAFPVLDPEDLIEELRLVHDLAASAA